ncbi:MAG: polymerase ECF-type sigma factor [Chthonomonadales bacterium]|nr:polymerase ECF-type sigma factor [Chthonomonadales bacterium]
MESWSDEQIWRGLRDENRRTEASQALMRQYAGRLLGFLRKKCDGDMDMADDLLGQVMYKAFLGLAKRETACDSLSSWLFRVAVNTVIDHVRNATHDPLHNAMSLEEELTATVPGPKADDPSQESEERINAIAAVLCRLDTRTRTLVEMDLIGNCPRDEIAAATGIATKQISQYLKRAKEQLLKIAREYPVLAALERDTCQGERQ